MKLFASLYISLVTLPHTQHKYFCYIVYIHISLDKNKKKETTSKINEAFAYPYLSGHLVWYTTILIMF